MNSTTIQNDDDRFDNPEIAPDFALVDTEGRLVRLTSYLGRKHVVLVFNRGFG